MRPLILLCVLVLSGITSYCQIDLNSVFAATGLQKEATDGVKSVSNKSLHFLQKKYDKLNASIDKQSQKMLARMHKKEEKLERKVRRKDSTKADQLFKGTKDKYASLEDHLKLPCDSTKQFPLKEYVPGIDSMQTALNFLKSSGVNLPADKL